MLSRFIFKELNFTDFKVFKNAFSSSIFVPNHQAVNDNDIDLIQNFLNRHKKILVLTGAGISTESGIPDYRSEGVGLYARSSSRPVQYQEFIKKVEVRRRYWARNYVGWPRFSSVLPNVTHFALHKLETESKKVISIVTQNVDGLHWKAGSEKVIELHGTAYRVICLDCDYCVDRHMFQQTLSTLNPSKHITPQSLRPDGDVDLSQSFMESFVVPECPGCQGILKPDIVFFGDNVPKDRVELIKERVVSSDSLLVLGSSLSVFSAYRIILQASELGKTIAIVNIGETRGDNYAQIKIGKKCGELFSFLFGNQLISEKQVNYKESK